METGELKAKRELVLCMYQGDELVAVIRKPNGHFELHATEKMGFDDVARLYNADVPEQATKTYEFTISEEIND